MLEILGMLFVIVLIIGTIAGMLWIVFSIFELKEKAERRYNYHNELDKRVWDLMVKVLKLERNAEAGVDPTKSPDPVASSNPIS